MALGDATVLLWRLRSFMAGPSSHNGPLDQIASALLASIALPNCDPKLVKSKRFIEQVAGRCITENDDNLVFSELFPVVDTAYICCGTPDTLNALSKTDGKERPMERIKQAYGYARVSDRKQIKQADSIPEQEDRCQAYWTFALESKGIEWRGVESDGFGVSARNIAFADRPAGRRLLNTLQPGDHLIVDKLDRIWRDPYDAYCLINWFEKHDITFHIVYFEGMQIDMSTCGGRMFFHMLIGLAKMESDQIAERVMMHNAEARKQGRAISPNPPPGCHNVKRNTNGRVLTYIEWDLDARAVMAEIVRLHEEENMPFSCISDVIEMHHQQKIGNRFPRLRVDRHWTPKRCGSAYYAERYYKDHNIVDVRELPRRGTKDIADYGTRIGIRPIGPKRDGSTNGLGKMA